MTTIVAEIGSNWSQINPLQCWGDLADECMRAGVDFIKSQDWSPIEEMNRTEPWKERCRPWTLPPTMHTSLQDLASNLGMQYTASLFTKPAVDRARAHGYPAIKIASSEVGNQSLLRFINNSLPRGRDELVVPDVWLSTGEADENALRQALAWLPDCRVTLMACLSEYPVQHIGKEPGLRMLDQILWLKYVFSGISFGMSSHLSAEYAAKTARNAVRFGCEVLEFHVRLEGVTPENSPDNGPWALYPDELAEVVKGVRGLE